MLGVEGTGALDPRGLSGPAASRGAPSPEGAGTQEPAQGPCPRPMQGSDLPVLSGALGAPGTCAASHPARAGLSARRGARLLPLPNPGGHCHRFRPSTRAVCRMGETRGRSQGCATLWEYRASVSSLGNGWAW